MHPPADPLRTLASYVPELSGADDRWRLRVLLHDFGLVWQATQVEGQAALLAEEPTPVGDARWDAFLAAYAEHLAYHAGLPAPGWALLPARYLRRFWFPLTAAVPTLRVEALVHAPGHFEAHGVLLARRELVVV